MQKPAQSITRFTSQPRQAGIAILSPNRSPPETKNDKNLKKKLKKVYILEEPKHVVHT